jgi:hypothetical protein
MSNIISRWFAESTDRLLATYDILARDAEQEDEDEEDQDKEDQDEEEGNEDESDGYSE